MLAGAPWAFVGDDSGDREPGIWCEGGPSASAQSERNGESSPVFLIVKDFPHSSLEKSCDWSATMRAESSL